MYTYDTTPGTPGWVYALIAGIVISVAVNIIVLVQFLRLAHHGITAFRTYNELHAQAPAPGAHPDIPAWVAPSGPAT